ncbi:MAG: hypothetical protein IPI39_18465 [Candidatus Obscuribacter sp.]|nr:hypothetical protein [Candidatus Obscuribacter sp.]
MQLKKRILAFALLTFWLGSLFSPSRAVDNADNLSQLKNADPEQKVTVCIDLIDKKIIHPGMPISELDNTLNPGYSTTLRPGNMVSNSVFHFGGTSAWYLGYSCDSSGKVISYALSNVQSKWRSYESKADSRMKVRSKFLTARSGLEKLQVCVTAMDECILRKEMKTSEIKEIFGTFGQEEIPEVGHSRRAIYFGQDKDSWRLYYEFNNRGVVKTLYLSNVDRVRVEN